MSDGHTMRTDSDDGTNTFSADSLHSILNSNTDMPEREIQQRTEKLLFPHAKFRFFRNLGESIEAEISWPEYYTSDNVTKDDYTWHKFMVEYYYDGYNAETDIGCLPHDTVTTESGDAIQVPVDEFSRERALGQEESAFMDMFSTIGDIEDSVDEILDERTVDVDESVDEDKFFKTVNGKNTVTDRYDLEKSVPQSKKSHFVEIDRYWVNKPYAFIILFRSTKENEVKYYAIEPSLNEIEAEFVKFIRQKINQTLQYRSGKDNLQFDAESQISRAINIEEEFKRIVEELEIYANKSSLGLFSYRPIIANATNGKLFNDFHSDDPIDHKLPTNTDREFIFTPETMLPELYGEYVRPEEAIIKDDPDALTQKQLFKILYILKRDFVGYELIDPIKYDVNVEDISCDGYNSPVFVYHTEYEQIITNIYHGENELDDFVTKMAQRSGKGISKRRPQVDATLPDGSRAQLTLGREVSDHGTNYTIRQFKDVPFTPVDLINWKTFSLDEMAFLWLAIENNRSLIFAGGTASGKTTSLNATSLFIPSSSKIVSIEDTREVKLPQRNWIASVTRPSFTGNEEDAIDEFELLESALRQRPDYIIMGEIRGEEGRTAFQVMSTGHTTYTTFHADTVSEVIKRFTTDPINVSKTLFTALDLISIQTSTRVDGNKVRRNKVLTEINNYDSDSDEINVRDVFRWNANKDSFIFNSDVDTVQQIMFDRGWNEEKLDYELFTRRVVLAYLVKHKLNTYTEVAATLQAFMREPETVLTLIKYNKLSGALDDLREMESVEISVDPEDEELVPRPSTPEDIEDEVTNILETAKNDLYPHLPEEHEINIQSVKTSKPDSPEPEKDEAAIKELQEELEDATDSSHDTDGFEPVDTDSTPKITDTMLANSSEVEDGIPQTSISDMGEDTDTTDEAKDGDASDNDNIDDGSFDTDDGTFKQSGFESSFD